MDETRELFKEILQRWMKEGSFAGSWQTPLRQILDGNSGLLRTSSIICRNHFSW